jgi:hypothetical protein
VEPKHEDSKRSVRPQCNSHPEIKNQILDVPSWQDSRNAQSAALRHEQVSLAVVTGFQGHPLRAEVEVPPRELQEEQERHKGAVTVVTPFLIQIQQRGPFRQEFRIEVP